MSCSSPRSADSTPVDVTDEGQRPVVEQPVLASIQDATSDAQGARPIVLVAEDNRVNQRVARAQLEKLGFQVELVENGHEAVAAVAAHRYALVLMDCQMPELDGYDATRIIREQEGSSDHVPIIAMTAHVLQGEREKCLASGMDDYLSKPVTPADLSTVLGRWVDTPNPLPEPKEHATPAATLVEDMIDQTVLTNLRNLHILPRAIGIFLKDTPSRLDVVHTASLEGDLRTVARYAHALRGSCGNIGARRMAQTCVSLEALANAGKLAAVTVLVDGLIGEFNLTRTALQAELSLA